LGHNLKGAGGSYGFQPITDLAIVLVQAAERADLDRAYKAASELSLYLQRAQVVSA
jgi:hypothetical protein